MFLAAFELGDVPNIINDSLRSLCAWLCEIIYPAIAQLYEIFKNLGTIAFAENFQTIYNKISLIIGIFMVFRVSFWLIELLVSPDKISDKEKNPGNIIKKILVAVVLLATTPTIFKWAFKIQDRIIEGNIIEQVVGMGNIIDPQQAGRYMAAELFINFYTSNEDEYGRIDANCDMFTGPDGAHYSDLITNGKFANLNGGCLTDRFDDDKEKGYIIDFNGIFAVGVGGFVFWMILMYCISLGTRYVQLIYLQIVAPIPIMCYLAPGKDNMFSKWVKQCTTTYLDLFIRIAIINFVMLLATLILNNDNNIILNIGSSDLHGLIKVFLVLGLLAFAKKAPDLIQELLPKSVTKASGDFGLSWKKRTDNMLFGKQIYGATTTAARAATYGVAGGAMTGAIGFLGGRGLGGKLTGAFGGIARGIASGAKSGSPIKNFNAGVKKQQEVNKRNIDWANNGSTLAGRIHQRAANAFGFAGPAETYENQISRIDRDIETYRDSISQKKRKVSAYKQISEGKSSMESRAENKLLTETYDINAKPVRYALQKQLLEAKAKLEYTQKTATNPDDIVAAQMNYNSTLKEVKEKYITAVINGSVDDKAMISMLEHMKNVVKNDTDSSFEGLSTNFAEYKDLDKFEGETTTRKNDITEGTDGIDEVETKIKALEDEKAGIKAKLEYHSADANRNAVGGHKGGK